jgi:hypothetical protein
MSNIFTKVINWIMKILQREDVKKVFKKILWTILDEVINVARNKKNQEKEKETV